MEGKATYPIGTGIRNTEEVYGKDFYQLVLDGMSGLGPLDVGSAERLEQGMPLGLRPFQGNGLSQPDFFNAHCTAAETSGTRALGSHCGVVPDL